MKRNILIILFVSIAISSSSQINTFGEEGDETATNFVFAIKLMPSLNGNLVQVAVKLKDSEDPKSVEYLTFNGFARQIAGYESSKANPNKENLIEKYNVFEVPSEATEKGNSEIIFYTVKKTEVILNNLWRLKYSEYPYFSMERNSDKGWAKHQDINITWLPSDSQMNILRQYGINELSEFIEGEDAMRLLKDVRDREWQNRYIQSAGVYQGDMSTDTIPGN